MIISMLIISAAGCDGKTPHPAAEYGVFLSSEYSSLPKDISCETLVIDAQYYSAEEISKLHQKNQKIYSYLNVGAIEDFRDYYKDYTDIFLGDYEHWDEEKFVDVSKKEWQDFILKTLVPELQKTGIDGLFIDNLDVYDQYPTGEIYDGITLILKGLRKSDLDIIINGGDVYISEYLNENGTLNDVIDGVNQEGVFTSINWSEETFEGASEEDTQYFLEYLEDVQSCGVEIFLIEYTEDKYLTKEIQRQCEDLNYSLYISDSVELD